MRRSLVVSHYQENLSWLSSLEYCDLYIYNKFPMEFKDFDIKLQDTTNLIRFDQLSNFGNEGHTFLHFICEYYNNLPELCVFLQGNPHGHMNGESIKRFFELGNYGLIPIGGITEDGDNGLPHWWWMPKGFLEETWSMIFGDRPLPNKFRFCVGAQYQVPKEIILKHPKEFYEKLRDWLAESPKEGADSRGWAIERMWNYIWGYNF